jgi:heme A synthase
MKFIKWLIFDIALYGGLTVAHHLGYGIGASKIITVFISVMAIVYFVALFATFDKDKAKELSLIAKMNIWNYFEFIWIIPVYYLGYKNVVMAQTAELATFYVLMINLKVKMSEEI